MMGHDAISTPLVDECQSPKAQRDFSTEGNQGNKEALETDRCKKRGGNRILSRELHEDRKELKQN